VGENDLAAPKSGERFGQFTPGIRPSLAIARRWGELPETFAGLRRRQVIFATLAGVLALLALLAGTLFRS